MWQHRVGCLLDSAQLAYQPSSQLKATCREKGTEGPPWWGSPSPCNMLLSTPGSATPSLREPASTSLSVVWEE